MENIYDFVKSQTNIIMVGNAIIAKVVAVKTSNTTTKVAFRILENSLTEKLYTKYPDLQYINYNEIYKVVGVGLNRAAYGINQLLKKAGIKKDYSGTAGLDALSEFLRDELPEIANDIRIIQA